MVNNLERKMFLEMEVRIVNQEYVVLKDIFNALNKLDSNNQITTRDRQKFNTFLEDIGEKSASTKCTIASKGKKHSKETQEVDCIRIDIVPMLLLIFKPSEKKDGSNKNQIETWRKLATFVKDLLVELEVYKYIITDKQKQKDHIANLIDEGGSAMIGNKQVNIIMAKLIDVYDKGIKTISKDELKIYQPQTTVDLLEVRDFVLGKFVNAYEFTGSHKTASVMAYELAKKKYKL